MIREEGLIPRFRYASSKNHRQGKRFSVFPGMHDLQCPDHIGGIGERFPALSAERPRACLCLLATGAPLAERQVGLCADRGEWLGRQGLWGLKTPVNLRQFGAMTQRLLIDFGWR
ncbi:hypothetical protein NGR_b23230 (plasmid) [Sinorhizobium fredii NGR234]|uniref:Uncharacterized protein n=1 Tax=Sinorhizobium fredii (strain NBRC 101917 / NGR234) TaxID=394 RepID=C3KND7_SINFN|nr:hypothetical protein NGR_b23230 [Sinorhizobium fredii NGR234]